MAYQKTEEKEKERDALRERIFDAAMDLLKEKDYESLTIREICQVVGMSTGMFYKLYESKLDLLSYYYSKAELQFDDHVRATLEGLPIMEKLIRYYAWVGQFTAGFGVDFCRHFFDSKNPVMDSFHNGNKMVDLTDRFIEEAIENGLTLSEGRSPHAISKELCNISKGLIFDWSAGMGYFDLAEAMENLMRRVLPALL